jgi:hypothetical protein
MPVYRPSEQAIVDEHPDGTPRLVQLDGPTEIDGIHCKSGLIHLHTNGALARAFVEKTSTVRGWTVEPGDYVSLRIDGSLESVDFAHVRAMVGQTIGGARFDTTGRLQELYHRSTSPERVSNILCTGDVTFHPSGQLASACLGESLKTRYGMLPANTCVRYDVGGALREATLASPAVVDGRKYEAGAIITFVEAGPPVQTGRATFYAPLSPNEPSRLHSFGTSVLGAVGLFGVALAVRHVVRKARVRKARS